MSCHECYIYQVYHHRAQGPQARGQGDYKPDIARVDMTYFMTCLYSLMKPQTTQCTYQTTVHIAHLYHCRKL